MTSREMLGEAPTRRFVLGMAAGGALAAVWPGRGAMAAAGAPVLSGTEFHLDIAALPINVTGRPRTAMGINGQTPGPILHWREGDAITLVVTNRLTEPTSIHWHGVRVPSPMDGVPGLSFGGIAPGETFVFRFPLHQSGTYWYHSHSALQEQSGVHGPIVIEPKGGYADRFDRDYVVMLADWTDENPETVLSNLKMQSDYYNFHRRTLGTFIEDVNRQGLTATMSDRLMWGQMRMSPTDILDVSGATYTYLVNGQPPAGNWTALFRPGERVRLRFIDAGAMTIFDVRIPGLPMTVVQTDGNDVVPVTVDEFRIGPGETYDVIVQPAEARAYTIFAQAQDRTGFARGTLAPQPGMAAAIPPMDPRPTRTMADMGMGGMEHGAMPGMSAAHGATAGTAHGAMAGMPIDQGAMPGMSHGATAPSHSATAHSPAAPAAAGGPMAGMAGMAGMSGPGAAPRLATSVEVDNVAMTPQNRLAEPGEGFPAGRRVLRLSDLRALKPGTDPRPPDREIVLHLTGNMERFIWGFDGKKFSEAGPIRIKLGERVRFTLINDTMMEHPMHLHGLWSELENNRGAYRPYKHTILIKPGERLSFLVNADEPGRWAFHCHLLLHMEMGMFREVRVA